MRTTLPSKTRARLLLAAPWLAALLSPCPAWADGSYFATCTGFDTQSQPSTGWDYSSGTPTMTMTTTTVQMPRSSSGQGPTPGAAEQTARAGMGAALGVSCSVSGFEDNAPGSGD
ncbi:MAG: hypothetical protein ACRC20_13905 [Segniliparus sp.]|uniref:hypothetical protein n=1 Tax=Segniliparus sp. TaxID=2804064 RepID=UPI003F3FA3EE